MKISARVTLPNIEDVAREIDNAAHLRDLRSTATRVYEFEEDGKQIRIELDRNDDVVIHTVDGLKVTE